jgi:hypothetical protein
MVGNRKTSQQPFDPSTPISELSVCIQAVLRSDFGTASEGQFVLTSAPIVQAIPEAFQPFMDRIG